LPIVRHPWFFFPVWPHVHSLAPALAALHAQAKARNLNLIGILIDADNRSVLTRMVEAVNRKTANALLAHVAERHRRAGFVTLLCHRGVHAIERTGGGYGAL
jgi:hypothetical protein